MILDARSDLENSDSRLGPSRFRCMLLTAYGPKRLCRRRRFITSHLTRSTFEAAIDFYTKYFPSTSKTTFDGKPALKSPNNVLVLFNKVNAPPSTQPPTAFWHFGWHVTRRP